MSHPILGAIVLGTYLGAMTAHADDARLLRETTLRTSPTGGEVLGLLTGQAPVSELERQGEWVRVRIEGWVPAGALAQTEPPAQAEPGSRPPVALAAASTQLEGTLALELPAVLHKKKLLGSGQQIWLLPPSFDLEAAGQVTAEDETRLGELEREAERIAGEAAKALQGSNFTESTRRYDALMAERRKLLAERTAILGLHHGRRQVAARQAALATAVCDSRGFFAFPALAPGAYRLYARLVDRDLDLEWIEAVEVGVAGARIDLDETRARGLPPRQ